MQHFIIYAPNVHTGGGLVLLRSLLLEWRNDQPLIIFLDARACNHLTLPIDANVIWVEPRFSSRLYAEIKLSHISHHASEILCFHGLPPLLNNNTVVSVYLHNRLLIQKTPFGKHRLRTRIRIQIERFFAYLFRFRVNRYIVQTPSMLRAVESWLGDSKPDKVIHVIPFLSSFPLQQANISSKKTWDFVYLADGEAHKNHLTLLEAWRILASEGIRPSLALTLGDRDLALSNQIAQVSAINELKIINLGYLSYKDVIELYSTTHALIFPSISESFGLPLIEASQMGLPILASELDFVRDVCRPAQTFDPTSPISIARAVKRHLRVLESPLQLLSPTEFVTKLRGDCSYIPPHLTNKHLKK